MPPPYTAVISAARKVFAVTVGAFLLWLIVAVQLFVNTDPLTLHRTEAVIMLGGAASERLPAARQVQEKLGIPVLVLSQTDTLGNRIADAACGTATFPNPSLLCFRPPELDTRGEARAISRLVELNGWTSVTVVTSSYHVTRAGRLIRQCTGADVQMVASHPDLSAGQWLRRFVIESGGLLDVSLRPECP
ncbi:YdcF family protein [Arthrobacter sp. PAMC25284]|uniref:YdcF family protein n=1 Tax=Arthrobacter sp. PAMC25284 TaxID=2861279 RepID=UPI002159AB78|nr:ElyC/SanA/YdcF family protein [Arthrobacter sp. PAMC25284]